MVKYTGYPVYSLEEDRADFQVVMDEYIHPSPSRLIYGVALKDSDELVGTVALIPMEDGRMEIGYRFRYIHWGKGYAGEVVPGLLEYAFQNYPIAELYAEADVDNPASLRILNRHMHFIQEVFNEKLNCVDRQYHLPREDFMNRSR